MVIYCGLDPSASLKRSSGLAFLEPNSSLSILLLKTDREIIDTVRKYSPKVIAIDSPLSHAKGYRKIDILLKKHGYKVLPPSWPAMRKLVTRSIYLASIFEELGVKVIETHPRSALISSNCKSVEDLLKRLGYSGVAEIVNFLTQDEKDAIIASFVAYYYDLGEVVVFRTEDGEVYLLPRICD
ncbi:MAG: DUF429 domain-containing protein [Staphylothermus sp.]|nr:DUF429 domain-containing protein [Staphylothermus sp.]